MNAHSTLVSLAVPVILVAALFRVARTGDKHEVEVTKYPATFEEKVLDLTNPPESIRSKLGKHKAFTACDYSLHWNIQEELRSKKTDGGNIEATVVLTKMDLTLDFKVTTYLPPGVSKKLRDHEAGHMRIGERMYEGADAVARRLAQAKIGRTYTGKGATPELARRAASKTAGNELLAEYLDAVQEEGQQIHVLYDTITNHGQDVTVEEDEAIKRAFEERKKQKAGSGR